jgi:hypothetical protein
MSRTGDEREARRAVLDKFGDPKKISRQLWKEGMRGRYGAISLAGSFIISLCIGIGFGFLANNLYQRTVGARLQKSEDDTHYMARLGKEFLQWKTGEYPYGYGLMYGNMDQYGGGPYGEGMPGMYGGYGYPVGFAPSDLKDSTPEFEFHFGPAKEVFNEVSSFLRTRDSPQDPFDPEGGEFHALFSNETFLIAGKGPDGDRDLPAGLLEECFLAEFNETPFEAYAAEFGCPGVGNLSEALRVGTFTYSPTNGRLSNGDWIRFAN